MDRLIVEQFHPHSQKIEHRFVFDHGKATVGRSYSNDIILDDPYVSPKHLVISRNGTGIFIVDLASENGTEINGKHVLRDKGVKVYSGDQLHIGRTTLKLILPDHPVEPAKPLDKMRILRQWLDRRTVAVGFTVFMAIFIVTLDYLDEPSARFWKNKSINKILEYLWLAFIYVGIAGLISHLKLKKSYIKRHLAVFNVTVLLTFVAIALEPFLFFWMSSPGWITLIQRIFIFFIISFMILGSIHLTKDLVKWKDWSRVTGLVLLFVLYVAWDSDDFKMNFSSSPEFPSYLSPHLNPIHDPVPLDEFLDRSSRELFRPLENGKVMEPPPATEISDTLREKPGN